MKFLFNAGTWVIRITFSLWLNYTIIYLFIDGWHYKPISEFEAVLDRWASFWFKAGLIMWFIPVVNVIQDIMTSVYNGKNTRHTTCSKN